MPFAYQSDLSGIGTRELHDTVWYLRRFTAPTAPRLRLHFGAVDYRATVWINDVEVACHEGGHTPFSIDISSAVRIGQNQLVVRADDPPTDRTLPRGKQFWKERPEGIFYTATTGIWQTVWLEPLPECHLTSLRLSPQPDEGILAFEAAASEPALGLRLEATLNGRSVGHAASGSGRGRLQLSTVARWTPDHPVLYQLAVTAVDEGGGEVDRVDTYFGLRSVAGRDGRFWLNGEPFVQRLILDQGYFEGGWYTAASDADLKRDIELAKSLGFNGARKHQKIEDPRWLYWADRLGFLVWAEMPSFHAHSLDAERRLLDELAAMITRDQGHPSIVAWVPVNESFGLDAMSVPDRARFLVGLYDLVHRLDGERLVSSNDGWEHAVTDLCTVHDYGSPTDLDQHYRTLNAALARGTRPRDTFLPGFGYGGQPLLVTEFGGIALAGSGGWGFAQAERPAELLERYGALVAALMANGPVEGFCYTQLTDIEQERNGLLAFDRRPKADPARLRSLTLMPKRH